MAKYEIEINDDMLEEIALHISNDAPITVKEIKENKALCDYLCLQLIAASLAYSKADMEQVWNSDVFCDWQQYRQ